MFFRLCQIISPCHWPEHRRTSVLLSGENRTDRRPGSFESPSPFIPKARGTASLGGASHVHTGESSGLWSISADEEKPRIGIQDASKDKVRIHLNPGWVRCMPLPNERRLSVVAFSCAATHVRGQREGLPLTSLTYEPSLCAVGVARSASADPMPGALEPENRPHSALRNRTRVCEKHSFP